MPIETQALRGSPSVKGQAAIEFMTVFGMVMIFFVIMQIYSANQVYNAQQEQTTVLAQNLASQWATTIQLAGDTNGFSLTSQLPSSLDRYDTHYLMVVRNQSITISWGTGSVFHTVQAPVWVSAVSNSTGSGTIFLVGGQTYTINGTNGVVWVV